MNVIVPFCASPSHQPSRRQLIGASLLTLGLSLAPATPSWAQSGAVADQSTALGIVVRFRYLSQRLAKAYTSMLLGVLNSDPALPGRAALESSEQTLKRHLGELAKLGSLPAEIKQALAVVGQMTDALLTKAAQPPTRASAETVSLSANNLLKAANDVAVRLEALIARPAARLVNTSGSQRFLSQRIAKNYLLQAAGLSGSTARADIQADLATFKTNLATLKAAPLSTPAISHELEQGQAQLLFFETALNKPSVTPLALRDVMTTSERLLEVMDKLTGLYEAALRAIL